MFEFLKRLDMAGVGAVAMVVASAVVLGTGATGGSVVASESNPMPDSALYGYSKVGEDIQSNFVEDWDEKMAERRLDELDYVSQNPGKVSTEKVMDISEEAENHINEVTEEAEDENGLKKAENMLQKHVRVLERVKENTPAEAQTGLNTAIERSQQRQGILENSVSEIEEVRKFGRDEEEVQKQVDDIVDNVQNQVRKKVSDKAPL